jgi:hypothetical protein
MAFQTWNWRCKEKKWSCRLKNGFVSIANEFEIYQ